ncbi:hypothetical protein ACXR2U_04335 [Jatrophihabitans sp. YIM 134969]
MTAVLELRARGVRDGSGAAVAFLTGRSPGVTVEDPDGVVLLRVEKPALDPWYARRPDGWALLCIDPSVGTRHAITYADGRTGSFDAAPSSGAWELHVGGGLAVHARALGAGVGSDWTCAQDGTLELLDFLATVVTYREVRMLRSRRAEVAEGLT